MEHDQEADRPTPEGVPGQIARGKLFNRFSFEGWLRRFLIGRQVLLPFFGHYLLNWLGVGLVAKLRAVPGGGIFGFTVSIAKENPHIGQHRCRGRIEKNVFFRN